MRFKHLLDTSYQIVNTPSLLNKSMLYYVKCCGHCYCMKEYNINRKNLDSVMLLLTLKGKGVLNYKDRKYDALPGKVLIFDCIVQQNYSTAPETGSWEFVYIHFNGSESKKIAGRILYNWGALISAPEYSRIFRNIQMVIKMAEQQNPNLDIIASCLIFEILTDLLLGGSIKGNDCTLPEYIIKARELVESNYSSKLNISEVSRQVNTDRFFLTKQFKKYFGQSLYEYIINYRLNQSKQLLRTTALPVSDIAEKVGFDSTSHFIRVFKKNEKVTPLQYRTHHY